MGLSAWNNLKYARILRLHYFITFNDIQNTLLLQQGKLISCLYSMQHNSYTLNGAIYALTRN